MELLIFEVTWVIKKIEFFTAKIKISRLILIIKHFEKNVFVLV